MIDWLTLRIDFRRSYKESFRVNLSSLGISRDLSIDRHGVVMNERHPWESIPSSYSGMAFKVFDFRTALINPSFFVVIKGSPAKLMQGHNVYGSDDLAVCANCMIGLLEQAYPQVCQYLDFDSIIVEQVDITYFSRAEDNKQAQQFLTALANISKGQTKSRTNFAGETVYFGKKNSRLKKLKIYLKLNEVIHSMDKLKNEIDIENIYTPDLLNFCYGMIRWEASLKSRYFERRKMPKELNELCQVFNPRELWIMAFKDIFEAIQFEDFVLINDDDVYQKLKDNFFTVSDKTGKITYTKANTAYRIYRAIKTDGFDKAFKTVPKATFYDSVKRLSQIGLSRAMLQNLTLFINEFVPMFKFTMINFDAQYPPDFDNQVFYS